MAPQLPELRKSPNAAADAAAWTSRLGFPSRCFLFVAARPQLRKAVSFRPRADGRWLSSPCLEGFVVAAPSRLRPTRVTACSVAGDLTRTAPTITESSGRVPVQNATWNEGANSRCCKCRRRNCGDAMPLAEASRSDGVDRWAYR